MRFIRLTLFAFGLFSVSCPPAGLQKPVLVPDFIILKKAQETFEENPLYAYNLLKNVYSPEYQAAKNRLLIKIYINQREYVRALELLDSISLSEKDSTGIDLSLDEISLILLKTASWEKLFRLSNDTLLKGISAYQLGWFDQAVNLFSNEKEPRDYRLLYLTKTYQKLKDQENALKTLLSIDSISPYLFEEYQNLLFSILINLKNLEIMKRERLRLKNESLKEYLLLKIYELENQKIKMRSKAWELVKNYPGSIGARYALSLIKPKTKLEHKLIGRVYFLQGDFENAIKNFKNAQFDDDVYYYLGKIYYDRGDTEKAVRYFSHSHRADACYYRGLIYENRGYPGRAIAIYDSLVKLHPKTKYITSALRRKGFLLEELGDTLGAVKTFVQLKEKNTDFRAALQLFRLGRLTEAVEILKKYDGPDFIYWQIRLKERLGESADSLRNYLHHRFPFSYYALIREENPVIIDTISMENWFRRLGDTTLTLNRNDSLHLKRAIRYFELGETSYALCELQSIETKTFFNLVYLSKLCASYGADRGSIRFSLELKERLEKKMDDRIYPVEFLRMVYPIRYIFSILNSDIDLYLILALIWQESLFDPNAKSSSNALGLMQIIPSTGEAIAKELGISSYSLYEPQTSIMFGCHYFKKRLNEFESLPLALAAYNAGPARLKKWLAKNPNSEVDEFIELIPYNETRDYVRLILARKVIYKKIWAEKLEGLNQQLTE
uniref:Tetratricopeptide repeat protein n=1 Tax=candidate division WOR-3 bacterium TaxID=2052148 RepID=A0A7C4XEH5_UNCW3